MFYFYHIIIITMKSLNNINLNPNWVTGFSDAEASFIIQFFEKKSGTYQVQPSFSINLHSKDTSLLKDIQVFFNGVGTITFDNNRNTVHFRVSKLNDLINIIIPHF